MSKLIIIFLNVLLNLYFTFSSGNSILHLNLTAGELCLKGNNEFTSNSYCRRFDECPESRRQTPQHVVPILCSFDDSYPIICCLPKDYETKRPENTTDDQKQVAGKMCHKYSKFVHRIPEVPDFVPYIVGGKKAVRAEFPHMALIGFGDTIEEVDWTCGGSLISNNWVLSAAHCVEYVILPEDIHIEGVPNIVKAKWVRLGALYVEDSSDYNFRSDYKIIQSIINPNYQEDISYNDIALFRLDREVQFSDYVRPICLNVDKSLEPQKVLATGWGNTSPGGDFSSCLLKVELDYIPVSYCNNTYSLNVIENLIFGVFDEIQLCAGSYQGGKDTCQGDSGGPLQIKHANYPGMYTQIGVTSVGKSCADKNFPGVYTKISNYISWIEQIVWPN
ncbi:venom protease-like isoform X4 [Daktulosphaira vitifoliae]|uniref:venom protease-like isoform X2 n=1 Tax=Daktulosphaira vitifoliae TaxID=58002 RepID=UPI0021A9A01C|nr:venom protease-like isoform X2 [Daktulosphaira vitifoliae]XP_050534899.1 venom protease-like isoform X3 [Daktulosphaira vitifoliae]XP_050534900.1 venom protease-like isoform X4 [Daktulosphaira vitifoliae]